MISFLFLKCGRLSTWPFSEDSFLCTLTNALAVAGKTLLGPDGPSSAVVCGEVKLLVLEFLTLFLLLLGCNSSLASLDSASFCDLWLWELLGGKFSMFKLTIYLLFCQIILMCTTVSSSSLSRVSILSTSLMSLFSNTHLEDFKTVVPI